MSGSSGPRGQEPVSCPEHHRGDGHTFLRLALASLAGFIDLHRISGLCELNDPGREPYTEENAGVQVGGGQREGAEGLQQSTWVLLGGRLPGPALPIGQQLRAHLLLSLWLSL